MLHSMESATTKQGDYTPDSMYTDWQVRDSKIFTTAHAVTCYLTAVVYNRTSIIFIAVILAI